MSDDQLFEFVRAQHDLNVKTAESLGRIEQALKDTNHRLFGGDGVPGALPYLTNRFEKHEEKDDERFDAIQKPVDKLVGAHKAQKKVVAAILGVFTFEGSALAFYFHYLAGHVNDILSAFHK